MIYKNIDIILKDRVIEKGFIEFDEGVIKNFGENTDVPGEDMSGHFIMSGFIDTHVHGTEDNDAMDGDPASIEKISDNLLKEGTTSFYATTMTMAEAKIEAALTAIAKADVKGAKLQGIHLEGPYINPDYKGAQSAEKILKGDKEQFFKWQKLSGDKIKIVTLAPERQDKAFLDALIKEGIVISMGHSSADTADFKRAYELGIKRVTHCFNAMPKIHHRDLGLAGMALLYDDVMCEIIADKIHTSEETLAFFTKLKPADKITLVTDAMRAKNLKDGTYDLGGQEVTVKNGVARTEEGAIAGSTLTLDVALKNMLESTQMGLIELSLTLSLNPAKELGIDNVTGSIDKGKAADLVVLDKTLKVKKTIVDGDVLFEA